MRSWRAIAAGSAGAIALAAGLLGAGAANAHVSCAYDTATRTLSVSGATDLGAEVRRLGSEISFGEFFFSHEACAGAPEGGPTLTNTDLIVAADAGLQSLDIPLGAGGFAPGATPEPEGASEIEFYLDGPDAEALGTRQSDKFVFTDTNGLNVNPGENGDHDADIVLEDGLFSLLVASGKRGRDRIVATRDFRGSSMYAEGGPGNDFLRAGRPGAILEGGAGRDRIIGGGSDLIRGGPGKDLVRARQGSDEIGVVDGVKDRVLCGAGNDKVNADPIDLLKGCERVRVVDAR